MAITITIGVADKTSLLQRGSLSVKKAINERSLCDFELKDPAATYRPSPGQIVEIYDGVTLVFAGRVSEPEEEKPTGFSVLINRVPCNDWHEICDRFLVAEAYPNQTLAAIVANIRTTYLAGDGITAGDIQTGPIISKAIFNYVPVSQAFDELSELTGYQWEITPAKALRFYDRASYAAAWNITSSSAIRNILVRKDKSQYRNKQYVRAGKETSDTQTRTFAGDGQSRVFHVDMPIAVTPTITVGVGKSVGIHNVDTGKQWYWNKGETALTQADTEAVLTSANTLSVSYKGYYDLIGVSESPAEITARIAVEGGTGVYERVENRPNIDTEEAVLEYTEGLLRRYAVIGNVLTYETDTSGLEPGMIQNVVLSQHSLNGDFLITRVDIVDPGFKNEGLRYRITALDGEAVGGWAQFFRKLVQNSQTFVIRDNEVLTRLIRYAEGYLWGETTSVTVNACPIPSVNLFPDGTTLFPC